MNILKKIYLKYLHKHAIQQAYSYSLEGIDMILRSFYEDSMEYKGYYIDVGAMHPYRFSNSMYFYQKGWHGINIIPNPAMHKLFKAIRSRDINLSVGISTVKQVLNYYCFKDPSLNTFSQEAAKKINSQPNDHHIIKAIPVRSFPLWLIFDEYLPPGQKIDFLNIHSPDYTHIVLQSNDWKKYQPEHILVHGEISFEELKHASIYQFLMDKNYRLSAKTKKTLFFSKKKKAKNVFVKY